MGTMALKLHVLSELHLSWPTPIGSTKYMAQTFCFFAGQTQFSPPKLQASKLCLWETLKHSRSDPEGPRSFLMGLP